MKEIVFQWNCTTKSWVEVASTEQNINLIFEEYKVKKLQKSLYKLIWFCDDENAKFSLNSQLLCYVIAIHILIFYFFMSFLFAKISAWKTCHHWDIVMFETDSHKTFFCQMIFPVE